MRGAAWPRAIRAGQEVLLADGLQHHQHGPLKELVLKGWNADGAPLLARALRHVDSSHGRRLVAAGLHALEKIAEILIEMLRVLLGRLSVDPGGAVLARAPVRLAQPVDVDVVSQ